MVVRCGGFAVEFSTALRWHFAVATLAVELYSGFAVVLCGGFVVELSMALRWYLAVATLALEFCRCFAVAGTSSGLQAMGFFILLHSW